MPGFQHKIASHAKTLASVTHMQEKSNRHCERCERDIQGAERKKKSVNQESFISSKTIFQNERETSCRTVPDPAAPLSTHTQLPSLLDGTRIVLPLLLSGCVIFLRFSPNSVFLPVDPIQCEIWKVPKKHLGQSLT